MTTVVLVAIGLVVATTAWHYEVLRMLGPRIAQLHVRPCLRLLFVVFGCLFAHLVEIGMYTAAVHALAHAGDYGRFVEDNAPSWWRVWYYSAETYTSLGYGDELLEGPMRLLSGIECLNGLVLIGWTVSYLHMAMLRAWPDQLRGVE